MNEYNQDEIRGDYLSCGFGLVRCSRHRLGRLHDGGYWSGMDNQRSREAQERVVAGRTVLSESCESGPYSPQLAGIAILGCRRASMVM